jgi:multidrug efflux pump subunit AcrA (membrane-fusion protein)
LGASVASSLIGKVHRPAPLDELRARWRARREEFARFHATIEGATLCDELLAEFDSALQALDDEVLTLRDAAAVSGYTADHLARLIRQGRLPNAGRRRAPLVRRRDIPIKATRPSRRTDAASYNPRSDARSLVRRLRYGGVDGTE